MKSCDLLLSLLCAECLLLGFGIALSLFNCYFYNMFILRQISNFSRLPNEGLSPLNLHFEFLKVPPIV